MDGLAREGGQDLLDQPEVAGLVSGQDLDPGRRESRSREKRGELAADLLPDGGGLADAETDLDAAALAGRVDDGPKLVREQGLGVVDLPGERLLLLEDRFGRLERDRSDRDGGASRGGAQGRPDGGLVGSVRSRQDELGLDRLQVAALDLGGRLLDGVHEGRLGGALFAGEEPVDVRGQIRERGIPLAVVAEVGECPGEMGERPPEPGRIGALNDDGGGLAEGLGHDLDQPGARLEGRELELSGLDEVGGQGVGADQDGGRQGLPAFDLGIQPDDGERRSGRAHDQAGGELVRSRGREISGDDDDGVEAVGDAVAVLVRVDAFRRIEAREIELLACRVRGGSLLESRGQQPFGRAGPRQDDRRPRAAGAQIDGQAGAGGIREDRCAVPLAPVGREERKGRAGLLAVGPGGEMDLDDEVGDLALLERQGLEAVGDRRRSREFVDGLAHDGLERLDPGLGQEGVEISLQAFVRGPGLASPDLPEVGPAQEEGPPGLEKGVVGAGDAGDRGPAAPREQEYPSPVGAGRRGIDAPLFQGLTDPGEVPADEDGESRGRG